MSNPDLSGLVALVTGGAVGIGRAIAEALAARGAAVAIADISVDAAAATAAALEDKGLRAISVPADVRDRRSVRAAIDATRDAFGRLDILVNNAGVSNSSCTILDMPEDDWDRHMEINVRGTLFGIQEAAREMIAGGNGGRIINIASTSAFRAYPGRAHYCTSKSAIVALTRSAALELAPHGITVNAVAPGPTATDAYLNLAAGGANCEEGQQMRERMARIPLGMNTPSHIADAVAFFASPATGTTTSQVLVVEGGGLLA